MRVLFFGSAEIGFQTLEALLASSQDELVGVVTQPDRPAGRKKKLTPCLVKTFAQERNIPIFSPEKGVRAVHSTIHSGIAAVGLN